MRPIQAIIGVALVIALLASLMVAVVIVVQGLPHPVILSPELTESVLEHGTIRVLVRLNTPFVSEGYLQPSGAILQRRMIDYVQEHVISALRDIPNTEVIHQYSSTPLLVLRITPEALETLKNLEGFVVRIDEQCSYHDAALCDTTG